MTDWITDLAAAGGSALVSAVATDAWQATKAGFARLFREGSQPQLANESALDESAKLLSTDPEHHRTMQSGLWTARLAQLLSVHPELADDLRRLISEVQSKRDGVRIEAHAEANGTVYVADEMVVHQALPAGLAASYERQAILIEQMIADRGE
jgi:hypothetical protein